MYIHYSTNWMGPICSKWIEENGEQWAAGRIDIYGIPDEPFGLEYGLARMHKEDWARFTNWLDNHVTQELWTFEELIEVYERNNPKIRWCNDD